MPEVLIEAVPFLIGVVIGVLTFDKRRPWPNPVWLGAGSVVIGTLQSALAGELAGGLPSGAAAVALDSLAVAAAWVGAHVAVRQARVFFRRA